MAKVRFKIRDLHREVALAVGFHHRNIESAHKALQQVCKGSKYSDMLEAIKEDGNWSESHNRTLQRIYLAACRVVEMMADAQLNPTVRAELIRDAEVWIGLKAAEIRLTVNLGHVTKRELERSGMLRPSRNPPSGRNLQLVASARMRSERPRSEPPPEPTAA